MKVVNLNAEKNELGRYY